MSTQIQLRRGTTSDHSTFTGAVGEVTVDTDKDTVVVHDGSTVGGHPLVKESALGTLATQDADDVAITGGSITGINTLVPQDSPSGAAQMPSGTSAERPVSPNAGMLRWNEDDTQFEGYDGSGWTEIAGGGGAGGGATGAGGDQVFWENDQTVTTSYTLTAGKNAFSAGPISIDVGATVTIPSGAFWTVI